MAGTSEGERQGNALQRAKVACEAISHPERGAKPSHVRATGLHRLAAIPPIPLRWLRPPSSAWGLASSLWVGSRHFPFGGGTPTRCVDVFDGSDGLAIEERSELLARCVATAGRDESEPAVVMRKHPRLYPFSLR
jgi:hypothetical protein